MQRLATHVLITTVGFVVVAFVIVLISNTTVTTNNTSEVEVEYKVAGNEEIETEAVLTRRSPLKTSVLFNEKASYSSAMTVLDELPSVFRKSRLI
jgi:hypothetical protein